MRIVGQLVCGPREKYLDKTLNDFKRLCDDVIVATCNSTKKDIKLIESYDFRHYADDREWGRYQPAIKTDLLKRIHKLGADYILVLDADETVPTLDRQELERISVGRESAFLFVVNLWNDEQHWKKVSGFWNVRFYRSDPSKGTQFLRKPVHCGNAPPYFYTIKPKDSYVPHILLHRGLMDKKKRLEKYKRYELYDPEAIHKSKEYYDMLLDDSTAKEYNQKEIMTMLTNYCENL